MDRVLSQKTYPKDAAWEEGKLPMEPILSMVDTDYGTLLFKPEIRGTLQLKEIAREFKINHRVLPKRYRKSLKELYDLVQALYAATGTSFDLRPPNLTYAFDTAALHALNLKRPSFVLFELSQVPGNNPQYIYPHTTFEQYVREFERYLNWQD